MKKTILLAKDLALPLDIITQTIAILAKRRAGKSYTMRRLVEQIFKTGQQVVLVDPKGDQWGVRSSADGKKPGLPIVILGGEHGDAPLEVNAGEIVAKLVVEERVSVLLDLSMFRKHEVATFMTAFLENLYRLKAKEEYRTPVMLVIDEADAIAPQKPQANEARMLGAAEDIVRRGGQRGIGCALITQRSAVLNKNVLTQAQMLVILRTIAPQDIAAMKAWVDVHGTQEEAQELLAALPALPVGEAYFWSPGWPTAEGIFQRSKVLPIETFDSGATPKPGERTIVPKNLADIDLNVLKKQMAATLEKAKNDDPKELRKQIATLTKQLGEQKPAGKSTQKDLDEALHPHLVALASEREATKQLVETWDSYCGLLEDRIRARAYEDLEWVKNLKRPSKKPAGTYSGKMPTFAATGGHGGSPGTGGAHGGGAPAEVVILPPEGELTLKAGNRKMLETIVSRYPMQMTKSQFATLAGMSPKSSTFEQYLSILKRNGLIEKQGDAFIATDKGIDFLGDVKPEPQTREERIAMWKGNLKAGAGKILDVIIEAYPDGIYLESVAELAGMSLTSSTFEQYVSILKRNGLIERDGKYVMASKMLMV